MPKLTIHCELETPDGEHEPVMQSIHLFERMPEASRNVRIMQALRIAELLPPDIGGLIAIGVCIASGKNTITSRPS
jgi:hypothetical protein